MNEYSLISIDKIQALIDDCNAMRNNSTLFQLYLQRMRFVHLKQVLPTSPGN